MKTHDTFIAVYKELENVLTVPVRDYENLLADDTAQKLRLCRMIRNYIQHTGDYEKFIAIAPGMIQFLEETVNSIKLKDGIVKDAMITVAKYGMLSETDIVADASIMMMKKKRTDNIVLNKNGVYCGYITKDIISDLFGEGLITGKTKISKIMDHLDVRPVWTRFANEPLCDAPDGVSIVTNTTGRIVGVFEKG